MGKNKVTMQDIADRLNISKNSVSLALSGKPGVSDETRDLIISLASKLGYSLPNKSNPSKSNNILVFIPEYIRDDRYFYNDICWSIDKYSKKNGLNAIMTTITNEFQTNKILPEICNNIPFIGIIIIGILTESYVRFLYRKYENIVILDNNYYSLPIPCIVTANIEGAYTLTRNVIANGHSNIGFIGSTSMTSSIYERFCGFKLALKEADISNNEQYNILQNSPLNILLSDQNELLSILKEMEHLPTAFVCGGDRIAIACIGALKSLGYRIPEDISVVGFDDIELGHFITPPLTTMHVNRDEMGRLAVLELTRTNHKQAHNKKICLYPEYIKRDSLASSSKG